MVNLKWELSYELHKLKERLTVTIVWALPRWVIYWAAIRMFAHGTTGKYGNTHPDELTFGEAAKRWESSNQETSEVRQTLPSSED